MNFFKLYYHLLLSILAFSNTAYSSFSFEPALGGSVGVWDQKRSGSIYNQTFDGSNFSYETLFKILKYYDNSFIGIFGHYSLGSLLYENNDAKLYDDSWKDKRNFDLLNLGAYIGLVTDSKELSFWVGFIPYSEIQFDRDLIQTIGPISYKGYGVNYGLSILLGTHTKLNFESNILNLTKIEIDDYSGDLPYNIDSATNIESLGLTQYLVYLSWPFYID